MRYIQAWIIRAVNRLLLILVATVTVAWMMFLLDMNAASSRHSHVQQVRRRHVMTQNKHAPALPLYDGNDVMFDTKIRHDVEQRHQVQYDADRNDADDAKPVLENDVMAEVKGNKAVPKDQLDSQQLESVQELHNHKHAVNIKQDQQKSDEVAKLQQDTAKDTNNEPQEGDDVLTDSSVLTSFTLRSMIRMPSLTYARETESSCFCVTSGGGGDKRDDSAAGFHVR